MASASIWVDADACPKVIKDILIRAAERTGVGGGPPPLSQADRNAFASHLDKWLARR